MNTDLLHTTHVVMSLDVGGLERLTLDLLREGRRRGRRLSVVCLERPGALAPQAEALGVSVHCVHKRPGLRPGCYVPLTDLFRRLRPDVVHTHQIGALFYAGPAARAAGVSAVIHTEHGKHFAHRWRMRWLGRLAAGCARRYCCVSRDIADEVIACRVAPASKVRVVPNGIDTDRFLNATGAAALRRELGIPPTAPVLGTIGRLTEIKRQDVLLRAFARVRESRPDAHLVLVGDGPSRPSLESLAGELGLGQAVHFTGYQDAPHRYLHLMNVFALTSRSEGMPLSVLEAWAAGVPVVASAVGGLPEMITDGQTGLLFPSGEPDAAADHCLRLLADQHFASRVREAAREHVESHFTLRRMFDTYEEHYQELLHGAAALVPA